jgi:phosphopantothenoylcysteine synthetase/decarboxylase
MTVFITTGPAWEPIDAMRRLTNASTGALGALLADRLKSAGHHVVLFRGQASTAPAPQSSVEIVSFGTNDDLARKLSNRATSQQRVDAVLHAAALCDFRVATIRDAQGHALARGKVSSREGHVILELEPAIKVLPQLRYWFPHAWIVGWKFEVVGDRSSIQEAAQRQAAEAEVDACVLNGPAWGEGFGCWEKPGTLEVCGDREALAGWIARRLSTR